MVHCCGWSCCCCSSSRRGWIGQAGEAVVLRVVVSGLLLKGICLMWSFRVREAELIQLLIAAAVWRTRRLLWGQLIVVLRGN